MDSAFVGFVSVWPTVALIGLMAPVAVLFLFSRGGMVVLLNLGLAFGVAASLSVALLNSGEAAAARDGAIAVAVFFVTARWVGAVVVSGKSLSAAAATP